LTKQNTNKSRAKSDRQVPLIPPAGQLEKFQKRFLQFEPHHLRKLVDAARAIDGPAGQQETFIHVLRRENEKQIEQLLRSMGLDPATPNVWERAFFLLAVLHHGVGHVVWRPRRTNKNAAKWSVEHDLALINEMIELRRRGHSERAAIKVLSHSRKEHLFPYKAQDRPGSRLGSKEQKAAALRARWEKIKHAKLEDAILGGFRPPRSSIEEALWSLDAAESLAKNKGPARSGPS